MGAPSDIPRRGVVCYGAHHDHIPPKLLPPSSPFFLPSAPLCFLDSFLHDALGRHQSVCPFHVSLPPLPARSLGGVCQRRCRLRGGAVSDDVVVVVIVVWRVSRDGGGGSCLVARLPPSLAASLARG